jgi:hypothetical protein
LEADVMPDDLFEVIFPDLAFGFKSSEGVDERVDRVGFEEDVEERDDLVADAEVEALWEDLDAAGIVAVAGVCGIVRLEVSVAFTLRDFLVPESIVERESK